MPAKNFPHLSPENFESRRLFHRVYANWLANADVREIDALEVLFFEESDKKAAPVSLYTLTCVAWESPDVQGRLPAALVKMLRAAHWQPWKKAA